VIHASCSSCGRKFAFQPDSARETCQICGGRVALPAGYVPPAKVGPPPAIAVTCPVCGRGKELEAELIGQARPCWFCQAEVLIPSRSGVATLALPDDAPAAKTTAVAAPADDRSPDSLIAWELLRRVHQAGRLGARAAEWIPLQLRRLRDWERDGAGGALPLDPRFAGAVVAVTVFRAHHTVEQPLENGGLRVSFQLEQKTATGSGLTATTILANVVGVTALFATGRGFIVTPGEQDDDPAPASTWLDIDLWSTDRGTEIGYAVRGSGNEAAALRSLKSREFQEFFPRAFAKGARGILSLKTLYGAATPARLFGYLTRDSLRAQIDRVTGDATFATDAAERVFLHLKD
jgi:hypothetical protein